MTSYFAIKKYSSADLLIVCSFDWIPSRHYKFIIIRSIIINQFQSLIRSFDFVSTNYITEHKSYSRPFGLNFFLYFQDEPKPEKKMKELKFWYTSMFFFYKKSGGSLYRLALPKWSSRYFRRKFQYFTHVVSVTAKVLIFEWTTRLCTLGWPRQSHILSGLSTFSFVTRPSSYFSSILISQCDISLRPLTTTLVFSPLQASSKQTDQFVFVPSSRKVGQLCPEPSQKELNYLNLPNYMKFYDEINYVRLASSWC